MGMSKMAENKAIKRKSAKMKAKPMYATKMNEKRIPAFMLKQRGIKGGNPLRPRGDIRGQTFGIDPFGPGMGAKKGKIIKARGGRLARVKPTKMM